MKHAFLIMAHHQFEILGKMMTLLDDERCAFYIHIDKKSSEQPEPFLQDCCKKSSVVFAERMYVNWGGYSQIDCTMKLMKLAASDNYDYYHLISGADFPIKKKEYILKFFEEQGNIQYVQCSPTIQAKYLDRIKVHSIFQDSRNKHLQILDKAIRKTERMIGYSRINQEKREFQFGSNWFSITDDFVNWVLQEKKWIEKTFRYTRCGDELFIQTLLINSPYRKQTNEYLFLHDNRANMRYVDFSRGKPYIFRKEDYDDLLKSPMLFARKFDTNVDKEIVELLYQALS